MYRHETEAQRSVETSMRFSLGWDVSCLQLWSLFIQSSNLLLIYLNFIIAVTLKLHLCWRRYSKELCVSWDRCVWFDCYRPGHFIPWWGKDWLKCRFWLEDLGPGESASPSSLCGYRCRSACWAEQLHSLSSLPCLSPWGFRSPFSSVYQALCSLS